MLFIFFPQDGSVYFSFNVKLVWDPNFPESRDGLYETEVSHSGYHSVFFFIVMIY